MSKKIRELQQKIAAKLAEATGFAEGESPDYDKAKAALDELDSLQADLQKAQDVQKRLELAAVPQDQAPSDPAPYTTLDVHTPPAYAPLSAEAKAFCKALRDRAAGKALSEGVPADGGLTVPSDVQTQINHWVEAHAELLPLIDTVHVTAPTGSRVYQKRSQCQGFAKVAENGRIPAGAGPKFEQQTYAVEKYAQYLAITNELVRDSDANMLAELTAWLGRETVATDNREILALIKTLTPAAIANLDDIKNALNVTLGLYAGNCRIVTNNDGLQWLDTIKDNDGKYLLSRNPQDPMRLQLAAGATVYPLTVVPNAILATEAGKIPMIMGDFKEFARKYDLQKLSITPSDIATVGTGEDQINAYEMDLTLLRGILRACYKIKDADAVVNGQITVA